MKNGIVAVISLAVGGAIGFFTADKLLRNRYETLVQEEVDSVKAAFRREHPSPVKPEEKKDPVTAAKASYDNRVENLGYRSDIAKPYQPDKDRPVPISPDEFASDPSYDEIELTYFKDGTVANESGHALSEEEIEQNIGKESLLHIGQYEPDCIHVKNPRLKAYFEILVDDRTYADYLKEHPYVGA